MTPTGAMATFTKLPGWGNNIRRRKERNFALLRFLYSW